MNPPILDRLNAKLDRAESGDGREPGYATLSDYYEGSQRVGFPDQREFTARFGTRIGGLAINWLATIVDSVEEREEVVGFRFGSEDADADAFALWQANSLDADSALVHQEALTLGRSFVLVGPGPRITPESARQVAVEYAPGDRRRVVAGLKRWIENDGTGMAVLYTPTEVVPFRSRTKLATDVYDGAPTTFDGPVEWITGEATDNPLGRVPIVPFVNKRTMLGEGRSEIAAHIGLVDSINLLARFMLIAADASATKQKWASGLQVPVDPETNQAIEPFSAAVSKLWIAEDPAAKFGTFDASSLSNFTEAMEYLVLSLLGAAAIPAHYIHALKGQFPNSDSLASAEAGLVANVRRKLRANGEGWEQVLRYAFAFQDDPRANVPAAETLWKDPERRTRSQEVDAIVKLKELGIPIGELQMEAGWSPQAVARFRQGRRADALDAAATDLAGVLQ